MLYHSADEILARVALECGNEYGAAGETGGTSADGGKFA